jgi:O-antigen/teichoic acid export membrane protein
MLYSLVVRISDNAAPAVNDTYVNGNRAAVHSAFLRLHKYTLLLSLPIALGTILFTGPLISAWVGSGQYAGASMAVALGVFVVTVCVHHVDNIFIVAEGRIGRLSILALGEGLGNLALSIILARWMGLAGVMWATVIANVPTLIYSRYRAQEVAGVTWIEFARQAVLPALGVTTPAALTLGALVWSRCLVWRIEAVVAVIIAVAAIQAVFITRFGLIREDRMRLRIIGQRVLQRWGINLWTQV